jgi:hypothetical protein
VDGNCPRRSYVELLEQLGQLIDGGWLIVYFGAERLNESVAEACQLYWQFIEAFWEAAGPSQIRRRRFMPLGDRLVKDVFR